MEAQDYMKKVVDSLGVDFILKFQPTMDNSYAEAVENSLEQFSKEIAFNRIPDERRNILETKMSVLCKSSHIDSTYSNSYQNNFKHFRLETPDFVITFKQGNLKKISKIVEEYNLFNVESKLSNINNYKNHLRIEHGCKGVFSKSPDFVMFVFPNICSFPLEKLLQYTTTNVEQISTEIIADNSRPKLRKTETETEKVI